MKNSYKRKVNKELFLLFLFLLKLIDDDYYYLSTSIMNLTSIDKKNNKTKNRTRHIHTNKQSPLANLL